MSEHDTDIEFDFFEDEPPTQETSRADRLIPRRGPRGPERPPRGPSTPTNLTPLLRLIGLIAFAILIVVLLVFWVKSCQSAGKEKTYKDYMGKVSQVAAASQQIGRGLSEALLAQGLKEAQVEQRITGLARQEQLDVDRARQITPPGTLRDEHNALLQALQFRVSGLNGLASALAATSKTKDTTRAAGVLASQMQRLLASDVIYDDSFKAPATAELDRQGVTGTNSSGGPLVPDSNFLQSADLVTATAMATVLSKIRGGSVTTPGTGGLRGTNLVSVKVLPQNVELSTTATKTIIVRTNMTFEVTVQDSGDSQEANIPVTLTIQQPTKNIVKHANIGFINPGETKTVTLSGFPAVNFGVQATVKVEVTPVAGETKTDNNSADYPVIFSA
ncbi:MAG: hypothetical protein QOG06_1646 [Gaiellaceae bacterium]|nr:hypothetical protein [Gaiellaceae bacterium]